MAKINRHSLFIINSVKSKRLILGISARRFSEMIKKSESYVGLCEGLATDQKYNSADYPLLAEVLACKLEDLLPPDDWPLSNSHTKVDKVVSTLKDPDFVKEILEGIAGSGNSKTLRDEKALVRYLNIKESEEREVVNSVLKGLFRQ